MKLSGKIEIAILALTLAVQVVKLIRERKSGNAIRIKTERVID